MSEGTFRNGDEWTGHQYEEEGKWWYRAVDRDGLEYDTLEIPKRKPLFTLVQYPEGARAADFPSLRSLLQERANPAR